MATVIRTGGDTFGMGHADAFYEKAVARALPLEGRVLDAGCGAGALLGALKAGAPGARPFGVDLDPDGTQLPRALAEAPVARGDLRSLPFPSGAFDAALCAGVLSYVPDPGKAVAELGRVLRPGGRLFLSVPQRNFRRILAWKGWLRGRFGYTGIRDPENRAFSRTEVLRLLKAAGLAPARVEASGPAALGGRFARKRLWIEGVKAGPPVPRAAPPGWVPIPVSLCMIVRDEALNLPLSLGAAKGWVDEIVVLDSGSSDRTPEIARQYADRVSVRPFADFADQKNAAVAMARNDWVLVLDADEYLDPAAWPFLASLSKEGFRGRAAFAFPRMTRAVDGSFHRWAAYYPNFQDRLFDRRRCRYVRPVHEFLEIGGRRGCVPFHIVHEQVFEPGRVAQRVGLYGRLEKEARRWDSVSRPEGPRSGGLPRLAFEFRSLYLEMALPLKPSAWGFLFRWTLLRLCPPLRRLGDKRAWIRRENLRRGLTSAAKTC